jgi:hypothetical protein
MIPPKEEEETKQIKEDEGKKEKNKEKQSYTAKGSPY